MPFALVTAMRTGGDVNWPPHSDRLSVISLALQPLSHEETDELARSLLAGRDANDRLLDQLYERSGGNPLFLQELAGLTGVGAGELPDSLRTLIGARLDQLTAAQRQVIENAATLGSSGSIPYLQKFATALNQTFSRSTVRELDELGLLDVHGERWEFRSDSVREAAYQTLTKASRAARHAGVARGLAETIDSGAATTAAADALAHHLATAAELELELGRVVGVPRTVRVEAIEALTAAASRALDGGSLRTVVRDATRALDLLAAPAEPGTSTDRRLRRPPAPGCACCGPARWSTSTTTTRRAPTSMPSSPRPSPPATGPPRARPADCSARCSTPTGASIWPAPSSASASRSCARPSVPTCSPRRCARVVSSSCSAAR